MSPASSSDRPPVSVDVGSSGSADGDTLRVVWDARVLCGPERRGIGTYAVSLVDAMRAMRPSLEILLFTDTEPVDRSLGNGCRPHVVGPTQGYRWQLWERVVLPCRALLSRADLLHSPANTTPPISAVPRVVTVHDVIPYLPDVAGRPLDGRYWCETQPRAIRRAAAVLTDSAASRADISRVFDISPARIHVVPLAVGADVAPVENAQTLLSDFKVREPYILALAAPAPRKNTIGTLRVFARASRALPDLHLVLTGVGSQLRPRIIEAMADLGIPSTRVCLLDFVDSATRNALYSRAAVFLFLSLYEGFGLPILEAMRCGVPVLCSNRSSCPEVAGDAAVVVDPSDEDGAAAALVDLVRASTTEREAWRVRGWANERQFTWQRTAEATLSVYDRIAG